MKITEEKFDIMAILIAILIVGFISFWILQPELPDEYKGTPAVGLDN